MRDSVCFLLNSNFDLSFCEKRPCDRCPQQIFAFVHRAGSDERPEVLSYEFVPKVLDVALGCATADSLFFQPVEFIILADVPGHGNDFTAIVFLEPRNDDRRIQAARIRQNDLLHLLIHNRSPQHSRELLFPLATGWQPAERRRNNRIR